MLRATLSLLSFVLAGNFLFTPPPLAAQEGNCHWCAAEPVDPEIYQGYNFAIYTYGCCKAGEDPGGAWDCVMTDHSGCAQVWWFSETDDCEMAATCRPENLAALVRDLDQASRTNNGAELRRLYETNASWISWNVDRRSIQILDCNGRAVINLNITPDALAGMLPTHVGILLSE